MTTLSINNKKHTIEMTKKFAKEAAKFGTNEYQALQEARRDYPKYKVVIAARKHAKVTYKGLTCEYMKKYIVAHDDEKGTIMAEYKVLRADFDP